MVAILAAGLLESQGWNLRPLAVPLLVLMVGAVLIGRRRRAI
jgi:uncharacterized membrane protein YoaK (UPF0700 family)